jgi:hypothetical protein
MKLKTQTPQVNSRKELTNLFERARWLSAELPFGWEFHDLNVLSYLTGTLCFLVLQTEKN